MQTNVYMERFLLYLLSVFLAVDKWQVLPFKIHIVRTEVELN